MNFEWYHEYIIWRKIFLKMNHHLLIPLICRYQINASEFYMHLMVFLYLKPKIIELLSCNSKFLNHHLQDIWKQMEILKIFHKYLQIPLWILSPIYNNYFFAALGNLISKIFFLLKFLVYKAFYLVGKVLFQTLQ
jgi:hypothetical protein